MFDKNPDDARAIVNGNWDAIVAFVETIRPESVQEQLATAMQFEGWGLDVATHELRQVPESISTFIDTIVTRWSQEDAAFDYVAEHGGLLSDLNRAAATLDVDVVPRDKLLTLEVSIALVTLYKQSELKDRLEMVNDFLNRESELPHDTVYANLAESVIIASKPNSLERLRGYFPEENHRYDSPPAPQGDGGNVEGGSTAKRQD